MTSVERFGNSLIIFFFAVFLLAPLAIWPTDIQPLPSLIENRVKAKPPGPLFGEKPLAEWIPQAEEYIGDHLGLRDTLIQVRNFLLIRFFGQSPTDRVIRGRDGWLFLATARNLAYYQAQNLYTDKELIAWRQRLQANKDYINNQGARYLIVIAPNKDTIYPEFMPKSIPRLSKISRLTQLDRFLEEESEIELLDVSPRVRENKTDTALLFRKGGSHWNSLGAFFGYTSIMEKIREWYPEVRTLQLSNFEQIDEKPMTCDLQIMTGMEHLLHFETTEIIPKDKEGVRAKTLEMPKVKGLTPQQQPLVTEVEGAPLKVVILHDSFMESMKPFLSETFGRTAFFHLFYYSPSTTFVESVREIVEREKPDLVIHETVERSLQAGVNFPVY